MSFITAEFTNKPQVLEYLGTRAPKIHTALDAEMERIVIKLQAIIKEEKLSGQVLNQGQTHGAHQGGTLRRNIFEGVENQGSFLRGWVGIGAQAFYGVYHEFGAHIPERRPVNAKALHWGGSPGVFAMRAAAFDLPERSFMRSTLGEQEGFIAEAIRAAIEASLREGAPK